MDAWGEVFLLPTDAPHAPTPGSLEPLPSSSGSIYFQTPPALRKQRVCTWPSLRWVANCQITFCPTCRVQMQIHHPGRCLIYSYWFVFDCKFKKSGLWSIRPSAWLPRSRWLLDPWQSFWSLCSERQGGSFQVTWKQDTIRTDLGMRSLPCHFNAVLSSGSLSRATSQGFNEHAACSYTILINPIFFTLPWLLHETHIVLYSVAKRLLLIKSPCLRWSLTTELYLAQSNNGYQLINTV